MIPEILKGIDLVLITGGGPGTNPRYVRHSLKKQNPQRYQFEKRIIKYALRNKIPLLGICRGAQMIAEVMGGKIRNLQPAKRLLHNQTKKPQMGVHWIRLESGILLHKALRASRIKVNSMHQQEAYSLPGSLVCSAISDDNVIEAFESKRKNNSVIGLQFHPERLYKRRRVFLKIITSLVENK
jgi:putative glutamine amidotransferase